MTDLPADTPTPSAARHEQEILLTLFDLGRRVTSVIELDELLPMIPALVGRLVPFDGFGVYFFSEKRAEIRLGYAVGYPEGSVGHLATPDGIVDRVIATQQPIMSGDVTADERYECVVPGMVSTLAVPLVHKAKAIGALNLLSRERHRYSDLDAAILRQFAAHVANAIVNARLFARERQDAEAFETLADIGREVASVLDLDELLSRIAKLARRLIDYRTFGILLLNEATKELEIKVALQYGEKVVLPRVKLGEGLVGYAAERGEAVLVPDVSKDPRYIKVVDDVQSALVVPMLLKDRCIGVIDIESPELEAFTKRDMEILTLLASHAAVAIENAQLYEALSANEARLERELHFAQRVQAALLPTHLPKRVKGVDLAASFSPARELGGDFYDFIVPDSTTLIVAVGDVSGKGVPAALYSVFAGELVRSRAAARRRYATERSSPAAVLTSINTVLHERQLEEYYCACCYAVFDLKRRVVTIANAGVPYPLRMSGDRIHKIELPGVPLGSFFGVNYDEVSFPLAAGDTFVFCSDGVVEAMNSRGEEFLDARLKDVVSANRDRSAAGIVEAIGHAIAAHRAGYPSNDDTTVVVARISS